MSTVIEATFDGEVFRPTQPVALEPNTPVRLTVEASTRPREGEPYSSLKALLSMRIDGPPDWSANIDKYLYPDTHAEEAGSEP